MSLKLNNKRKIWIAGGTVIIVVIVAIFLAVSQGAKPPASSTQEGLIAFSQEDEILTPGEDAVVSMDNVTLFIPGQVIESACSISIFAREIDLLPVTNDDWNRIQAVNVEYRNADGVLQQHVTFSSPIEICFQLSDDLWQTYLAVPADFQVQYLSEGDGIWEGLPTSPRSSEQQLCGQTDHLSIFALAVKQTEAIPVTGATEGPYEP